MHFPHTLSLKPLAWNKINVLQDKACQKFFFYIFILYVYYEIFNEHCK